MIHQLHPTLAESAGSIFVHDQRSPIRQMTRGGWCVSIQRARFDGRFERQQCRMIILFDQIEFI